MDVKSSIPELRALYLESNENISSTFAAKPPTNDAMESTRLTRSKIAKLIIAATIWFSVSDEAKTPIAT